MRVKASRLRSSWILNRFEKAFANDTSAPGKIPSLAQFRLFGGGCRLLFLGLPLLGSDLGREHDHLRLPARLLDLLLRRARELVRPDGDGLGQLAVAQDLQAALPILDRPGFDQLVEVDFGEA